MKAGALRRCCRAWLRRANHPFPRLMAFALTSPTTTVNTPATKHLSINQRNGILDIAYQGRGRGFARTKSRYPAHQDNPLYRLMFPRSKEQ